jgi:hypothetical protein
VPDQLYSSKSAYASFLFGTIKFGSWRKRWKSWAPPRCKFSIWLVFHNRCWTADRLVKRGLPHPEACPFCDQAKELIHHLLVGCVFTRQVWVMILQHLGLFNLAPGGESPVSLVCGRKQVRLYQKTCGRVSIHDNPGGATPAGPLLEPP